MTITMAVAGGPGPCEACFCGLCLIACAYFSTLQAAKIGKVAVTLTVSVPHIRSVNAPPTKVVIVGSLPELGAWDVRKVCMRFYTYVYLIFRCSHAGVR